MNENSNLTAEETLKETLAELNDIHKILDEFEETKSKKKLRIVTQKVKDFSPKLEQLWSNPHCKSKENSAMLIQLSSGMREAFTRIRKLSTMPSVDEDEELSNNIKNLNSPKINITPRASLLSDTVSNAPPKLKGMLKLFYNDKRIWYKRWFQQYGDKLYYFVSQESEKAISHITISEVSTICTNAQKGGFDLITSQRTYHLRTISDSDLQYWLGGLNQWKMYQENHPNEHFSSLNYISEEEEEDSEEGFLEEEKNEKFGMTFGSLPSENITTNLVLSTDTLKLSSDNLLQLKMEGEDRIKHLENQLTDRTLTMVSLDRKVKELSEKIEILERENNKYKQELEEKTKTLEETFSYSKSMETELEIRKKSNDTPYIDHLVLQLKSLELSLRDKEELIATLMNNQKPLLEKIRKDEPIIRNLTESLSQSQIELQAKQKLITKLATELKELRQHDAYKNIPPNRMRDEFAKLRDTIEAHQIQNRFLSTEIQKLQQESNQSVQLKEDTIQRLTRELDTLNKQFQSLRQQNLFLKGADNSYLQEFEDVKKELFYALGVGIKLHMAERGESCNLDIHTLYDEAQHINYKKWNEWITNRMQTAM